MNARVQSVIIPKSKFTKQQAKKWIIDNNFKLKKIDITPNFYRFRQRLPQKNRQYFTVRLTNGIELIMFRKL